MDLKKQRDGLYDHLKKKLSAIQNFYEHQQCPRPKLRYLDKSKLQIQVQDLMNYLEWKLQRVFDNSVECTLSLKDKIGQIFIEKGDSLDDIFDWTTVKILEHPIPELYVPYSKKDVVICTCQKRLSKSRIMKHLRHRQAGLIFESDVLAD